MAATEGVRQFVVESGIGYQRTWAKYRVFISYAWLHFHLGREGRVSGDAWYDVVIPNAVDPELFDFRPQEKNDDLLYLGRLNDDKGVSIAIDIAKRVGRRITVAGPGDPTRFKIDNPHAQFLPPVGIDERRRLLAEAAALVCPTRYVEPLGNVALEAQLSGTPVIATDWGGFTETVLHGVTGYRCRTLDQFLWAANNIGRIDPHVCRQWVLANYSPDRIGAMFDEYFRMLADLPAAGWYEYRPNRAPVDWLKRSYPCGPPY
jgi:glycosyltransferase involved in cell wall biosynthesis